MWKFKFNWDVSEYDEENAYWLARLSRMVYRERPGMQHETGHFWGDPEVQFYEDGKIDAQCALIRFDEGALLAYRGTESIKDWKTNLSVGKVIQDLGRVHAGFWGAMDALWDEKPKTYSARERHLLSQGPEPLTLRRELETVIEDNKPVFLCGHSLGGAMALLSGVKMTGRHSPTGLIKAVYTYGQPRSGSDDFVISVRGTDLGVYQHVNDRDIVPRVPPRRLGYDHVNLSHIYGDRGKLLEGQEHQDAIRSINRFRKAINPFKLKEGIQDHDMGTYVQWLEDPRWPQTA